jgi:hypothetical protein
LTKSTAYDEKIDRRLGRIVTYRGDDIVCGIAQMSGRECPCRLCANERLRPEIKDVAWS